LRPLLRRWGPLLPAVSAFSRLSGYGASGRLLIILVNGEALLTERLCFSKNPLYLLVNFFFQPSTCGANLRKRLFCEMHISLNVGELVPQSPFAQRLRDGLPLKKKLSEIRSFSQRRFCPALGPIRVSKLRPISFGNFSFVTGIVLVRVALFPAYFFFSIFLRLFPSEFVQWLKHPLS